ncbi:hypothetical protein F4604DRAFT_521121 [Suillus subluteus]|nr:hypothetical protein F4604DRAFT_521121 [Suillus subluteus]
MQPHSRAYHDGAGSVQKLYTQNSHTHTTYGTHTHRWPKHSHWSCRKLTAAQEPASIWFLIASLLATLDICKASGEKAVEIEPVRFKNAVFRTPRPVHYFLVSHPQLTLHLARLKPRKLWTTA